MRLLAASHTQSPLYGIYTFLAVLLTGSRPLPERSQYLRVMRIKHLTYLYYVSMGLFCSTWLALALLPLNAALTAGAVRNSFQFSPLSLLSGAALAFGSLLSKYAQTCIDPVHAKAVTSSACVIASYSIGKALFGEYPTSVGLSVMGIVIMIASLIGLHCTERFSRLCCMQPEHEFDNVVGWSRDYRLEETKEEMKTAMSDEFETVLRSLHLMRDFTATARSVSDWIYGHYIAGCAGVIVGLTWLPLHYTAAREQGLNLLPGIGLGMLSFSFLLATFESIAYRQELPSFHCGRAMKRGFVEGIIWGFGVIFIVGALSGLSYSVLVPILQCEHIVQGLWGIFAHDELSRVEGSRASFCVFAILCVLGSVMIYIAEHSKL